MRNDLARQTVASYLQAFHDGDVDKALTFCDDNIDMIVYAPITIFPHLGQKLGKAAVGESMSNSLKRYSSTRFEILSLLSDDDKISVMTLANFKKLNSERIVSVHFAHFFKLRNNRILEMRSFFDSFDAVQQILERDLTDALAASMTAPRPQ